MKQHRMTPEVHYRRVRRGAAAGPSAPSGRPELDTLEAYAAQLGRALGLALAVTIEIAPDGPWVKVRREGRGVVLVVRDAERPPGGVTPDAAHATVRLEIARTLARLARPRAGEKELDAMIAQLSARAVHYRYPRALGAPGPGATLREHAAAIVAHYQRELRLQDWRIDVTLAPDVRDPSGRPAWGRVIAEAGPRSARIVLRDPVTVRGPAAATAESLRRAIVRGLVKLHFASFGESRPEAAAAAVEGFAAALLSAPETTPAQRGTTPNPRTRR